MKEQLYTIPVNDAFNEDCECPLCAMKQTLETNAIEYTMGPSYMEDDIRAETDKLGFCEKHLAKMYKNQNRLGLSLMLKTHMEHTRKEITKLTGNAAAVKSVSFFKKKTEQSGLNEYIGHLEQSCFVCNKIEQTFKRYIVTILHLYKTDPLFKDKLKASKGFCTSHYGLLYQEAPSILSGDTLTDFLHTLTALYLDNMKRVLGDLDWFIDKFDYRFADQPWKNSRDALYRTMLKTNSIIDKNEE